jgi:LmbE family N-acetylglucosaminyl deacetylase
MSTAPLRLLIVGAHPDDADYAAGGLAALYRAAGHVVKMVSLTNGDAGHHLKSGRELAQRRRAEAAAAGAVIGAIYDLWDNHDGELLPTLENRRQVIRLLRTFKPDLVLTHRPNDYHPDHRYCSMVVQDAAYMVIAYLADDFQKPYPFTPSVVVDVGKVIDRIVDMLHCHQSQFYEWLPYNTGTANEVPADDAGRRQWLALQTQDRLRQRAVKHREHLRQRYGRERGDAVQFAEAFEGCEYGAPLNEAAVSRLFALDD